MVKNLKTQKNKKRGISLIEVLLGVFILSLVGIAIFELQSSVLRTESILSGSLDASHEASKAVKILATEIREARIGKDGSYPILVATSTEFVFFTDIDDDDSPEKIRYFLENRYLKKQVSVFEGNPPAYGVYSQAKNVINYLVNDVEPIFSFYDETYDGTSDPLPAPINIPSIRLVKIILEIDKDDAKAPAPIRAETNVMIRNLKDNR